MSKAWNFKVSTLQMKGRWESNINVWLWFMYSQKWNCAASSFPKQNYNVLSPNFHIHVSVSDSYNVFPGSVYLLCSIQIGRTILCLWTICCPLLKRCWKMLGIYLVIYCILWLEPCLRIKEVVAAVSIPPRCLLLVQVLLFKNPVNIHNIEN